MCRGNTVLPISPPAGSLLCPRSVVTNVFCHLTFAEQRETAGAWLARLCDPAPGQATVGSCCPLPRSPRGSHGTTFKPGPFKAARTPPLAPPPGSSAAPLQRSFLNPVPPSYVPTSRAEPGLAAGGHQCPRPHHAGTAECQDGTGDCGGAPGCIQQLSSSVDCKQIAEKLFSRNVSETIADVVATHDM